MILLACVLAPYLILVLGGYERACDLGLRRLARLVLERDGAEAHHGRHVIPEFATHRQVALMAVDLVLIVGGSFGMVQAALALGTRWGLAPGLVGALILGPLTSLPNALTGVRLGMARRGAALVTEAFNSNTINLVAGVAVPSLFVSLTSHSTTGRLDLALLALATVATVWLLAPRGGMRRRGSGGHRGAVRGLHRGHDLAAEPGKGASELDRRSRFDVRDGESRAVVIVAARRLRVGLVASGRLALCHQRPSRSPPSCTGPRPRTER